ncbi:DUF4190 domain-containing protein [Brachybacterium saurashtrense]|uniref:DUF4190 domain-containing protein n=1 Tax=Brachybacterium saurashtrense TaxID=556288 RepID=A0A345YQ11_9MICO|nr:DUF4190 domain-containing protein [Brachybacterium saurashtrense]AXK46013.1 hypothetical protein DWV08_10600 [Brachybacterium saurashtrense]RRR23752.1 hypothetical protein DXU92_02350 [Brachybacterium saurashtrense]
MSSGYGGGFQEHRDGPGRWADGQDPYAVEQGSSASADPYAARPQEADGFGPVFGAPQSGASGHGTAPSPYAAPAQAGSAPYGAPPSGGPQYGGFAPVPPSSGAATAGLVLGVLALTMCAGLTAPFGIWFSAKGMKETGPEAATARSGRGLAIAGLVTSLIGLIPLLFILAYVAVIIIAAIATAAGA